MLIQVPFMTFTLFDAGIRVLLEDGIAAASFARSLAIAIFAIIFGSFVG